MFYRVLVQAPNDYTVVIMHSLSSMFAHEVFRGDMAELCEFLTDIPATPY